MPLTRRRLLQAAGLVPIGFAVSALASTAGDAIRSAAAALRPPSAGTTATRCARCGARDHTMLDPRCPAAPKLI